MNMPVIKYVELVEKFLSTDFSAEDLQRQYFATFKNEKETLSESDYEELDGFFSDLDCFCSDPDLFEEGDLDEPALRLQAEKLLLALKIKGDGGI